ncbi:PP2C family protein-serine/threonine phosphatase [Oribacterium sp. WCC10]|uniref:PP2C family protein-serine/threonine phosphatase n=1 Tax=Oribacterium sp. WCC10 TaxID=1855343 RepID=UPI0008EAC6D8|nr:PP2C family protein-serine/threonine phosphatase [Oribacterium sp. WCC10]SFG74993.1 sigma-B regulation protein RsbU (phosphoserine phosphatase) [Oribacterium sp. WCC10]
MTGTKRESLLTKFVVFFAIFIVVTVISSAVATYSLQTKHYHEQYQDLLEKVNRNIEDEIKENLSDFVYLQSWFDEHYDELEIPFNYPDSAYDAKQNFDRAFVREYPGKMFGEDVTFEGLNDEVKLLYARYLYLYWLTTFDRMIRDYDLEYAYYIYPTGEDDTMCFMFDGPREEEVVDGKSQLLLAYKAHQDRSIHYNMWKTYETGQTTGEMDGYDNEYGHVYTYATPLNYNGKTIGVILTDVSYDFVKSKIRMTVLGIVGIFVVVLGLCSAGMITFVKRGILERILGLEKQVADYTETKNPELAQTIASENHIKDEIGSLAGGFSGMITELHEYMDNLTAVTKEKERISAELNVATEIQASMLPRIFPPFPDRKEFSLFASMDPAKEVGGDFYDFFMVDNDHIALVMADVSGKGIPAALFMAISKVLIKDSAQELKDPAAILAHTNEQLCEENDAELFVTVWLGIVDLKTGILTFADAGHEYPVLIHADGSQELIKAAKKRPPVATLEGIKYQNNELQLKTGDTVFLYTDGVPEATNKDNELYGMERTQKALTGLEHTDVKEMLSLVRKDVDAFVGDAVQFDDLTMLAFRLEELE